jgi:hypothetical protein
MQVCTENLWQGSATHDQGAYKPKVQWIEECATVNVLHLARER